MANVSRADRDRSKLLPGLLSFMVGRYVIFYRIVMDDLEAVRLLHSSHNIQQAFETSADEGDSDRQPNS